VYQQGIIFDVKKLENYISYRKRLETKFSAWMENRLLLLNVGKTLYQDGGWIAFCILLCCYVVIGLQNWLQPKCCGMLTHRLPMMCSLGLPFLVFICGFFFPFIIGSTLAELHDYDTETKQLSANSPFIKHLSLNITANICFLKDQAAYEQA